MSHFSNSIITWYEANKRNLPWRHTENPYYIWVSEIMLQQTQAMTVIPYYQRFITKLPTIFDLAFADENVILKLWEGLGYYSRVRNMQKTAKIIIDLYQGVFPNRYEDLIKLTGIGKYTAGAILSIAFKQKYSAVDGNVLRVLSRYYGIKEDISLDTTKQKIDDLNIKLLDDEKPHIYTQAIIEMGATLCTKRNPKCDKCPIQSTCVAYQLQLQTSIPFKSKAKTKKEVQYQTFILEDDLGQFVVEKVTTNLLKGLYLLPQVESDSLNYALEVLSSNGYDILMTKPLGQYKHVFTHLIWQMDVYYARIQTKTFCEVVKSYEDIPMATAHKQIIIKEKVNVKP